MKVIDSTKAFFKKITRQDKAEEELLKLQSACKTFERNRESLKSKAKILYSDRKKYLESIQGIQRKLSVIDNLPEWGLLDFGDSLNRLQSFQLAVQYEDNPNDFAKLDKSGNTATKMALGATAGVVTALGGPAAAMSIATVLGTASTGTAISALSGVAATNAALAWLGGGAVAVGGAGVAGGQLLLSWFGPIGMAIAGASTAIGIFSLRSKNKKRMEELHSNAKAIRQDNRAMKQKLNHLDSIIMRSRTLNESYLQPANSWIKSLKKKDYNAWTDEERLLYEQLLNSVSDMVLLINERV